MDPLRTPPAVAAFLTVIRESGADTATKTVVYHSIRLWAPSYHALRLTLREGDPLARERPRHSSLVVQTALALAEALTAAAVPAGRRPVSRGGVSPADAADLTTRLGSGQPP